MLSFCKAIAYYFLLVTYTYIYIIIGECLQILGHIMPITVSHYFNLRYYYSHAYLLIMKLLGIRIVITGEKIKIDRILWISNHRSKFDGLLIQTLLCASGNDVIAVAKNSIKYIPIIGSFGRYSDTMFIKRNKHFDEKILQDGSKQSIINNQSILIFPEGRTLSPDSKLQSDHYAMANNLPILNNVLLPKNTGFNIIQKEGSFSTIGDITLSYANPIINGYGEHSFLHLFIKFPTEIHINIRYHDISSNELLQTFHDSNALLKIFQDKDKYLEAKDLENTYKNKCNDAGYVKNNLCLVCNFVGYFVFYLLFYSSPIFRYATLLIGLVSFINTVIA